MIFLHIVEWLVVFYFLFIVAYTLVFTLLSFFYKKLNSKAVNSSDTCNRIAVFIPAYKEDNVIINAALNNLKVNYPKSRFDLIIIADQLKSVTIDKLRGLSNVIVHEVFFEKSTKAKALNEAIQHFDGYDNCVVLDADNVMHHDFLRLMNAYFQKGSKVVQGRRCAKNVQSSYSILDGINEEISNTIYRKGPNQIRLSAPITGSGIGFDYDLIKEQIKKISHVGEDKELQLLLTGEGHFIDYAHEAEVYDEKVESLEVFENQRKRWLYVHFHFLKTFLPSGIKSLFKGRLDYFNMAVLVQAHLPRMYNLVLFALFVIYSIILKDFSFFDVKVYLGLAILYIGGMFLAVPGKYFNKHLPLAILRLPKVILSMLMLVFKMKESSKGFIHTPHNQES